MKKIIIVNNNLKVGGVQKSLYNLLWTIEGHYDITLLLFQKKGEYVNLLPKSIKVIQCEGPFRYLGINQGECKKNKRDYLCRGVLAAISKWFGRRWAIKLMLLRQPVLPDTYDCAISFLHNGRPEAFYGGVQDYVLRCIKADRKVAFLHCDYRNCGSNHPANNRSMEKFDAIAACSDGCRIAFESVLPHLKDKCTTVRNCHRFEEIRSMAEDEPVCYAEDQCNVVIVSRLSHEKGVERAIEAVHYAIQQGFPIALHIVGGGGMYDQLVALTKEKNIEDCVHFYGEQSNPYRYMKNADLFMLTSYHEAAPMVIEEAQALGIPVLTVETTSSEDMVTRRGSGWVCQNDQNSLNEALVNVLSSPRALQELSARLRRIEMDNTEAIRSFAIATER